MNEVTSDHMSRASDGFVVAMACWHQRDTIERYAHHLLKGKVLLCEADKRLTSWTDMQFGVRISGRKLGIFDLVAPIWPVGPCCRSQEQRFKSLSRHAFGDVIAANIFSIAIFLDVSHELGNGHRGFLCLVKRKCVLRRRSQITFGTRNLLEHRISPISNALKLKPNAALKTSIFNVGLSLGRAE
jgi:hypothetical protein